MTILAQNFHFKIIEKINKRKSLQKQENIKDDDFNAKHLFQN